MKVHLAHYRVPKHLQCTLITQDGHRYAEFTGVRQLQTCNTLQIGREPTFWSLYSRTDSSTQGKHISLLIPVQRVTTPLGESLG